MYAVAMMHSQVPGFSRQVSGSDPHPYLNLKPCT